MHRNIELNSMNNYKHGLNLLGLLVTFWILFFVLQVIFVIYIFFKSTFEAIVIVLLYSCSQYNLKPFNPIPVNYWYFKISYFCCVAFFPVRRIWSHLFWIFIFDGTVITYFGFLSTVMINWEICRIDMFQSFF